MADIAKALERYRGNVVLALQLLKERREELERLKLDGDANAGGDSQSQFLKSGSKEAERTRMLLYVMPHQEAVVNLQIALQETKLAVFDTALNEVLSKASARAMALARAKAKTEAEIEMETRGQSQSGDDGDDHVIVDDKEHDVLVKVLDQIKQTPEHVRLEAALREKQMVLNAAEKEHEQWQKAAGKVAEYRGRRLAELDVLRDGFRKALGSNVSFIDSVISDAKSREGKLVSGFVSGVYESDSFPLEDAPAFIYTLTDRLVGKYPGRMTRDYDTMENATRCVHIALENHLFPQVYKHAFNKFRDSAADKAISDKCMEFRTITQAQLGVEERFVSRDLVPFAVPIAILKSSLYLAMTPSRKLFALLDAAHAVLSSHSHSSTSSQSDPSALMGGDAFIDIFIYCIIHANPPDLQSTINFIDHFSTDSMMQGELGYYFSSLQVAAAFIRDLTAEKLVQSEHMKNRRFVVAEPERFRAWALRDTHLEVSRTRVAVMGYRVWTVLDWIYDPSKLRWSLLEYTGSDDDTATVIVMTTNRTTTEAQTAFLEANFFKPPAHEPYTSVRETELGTMLVSDMTKVPSTPASEAASPSSLVPDGLMPPSSLSLVCIPGGDLDKYITGMQLRLSLLRLACPPEAEAEAEAEPDGTVLRPAPSQISCFVRQYRDYIGAFIAASTTGADIDLRTLDRAIQCVVTRAQVAMRHLGFYQLFIPPDGATSNLTAAAVASAQKTFKEMPRSTSGLGVLTADALRWLEAEVASLQRNLVSLGVDIGQDVCADPCEFSADPLRESGMKVFSGAIAAFQKKFGLSFPDGVAGQKTRAVLTSVLVDEMEHGKRDHDHTADTAEVEDTGAGGINIIV